MRINLFPCVCFILLLINANANTNAQDKHDYQAELYDQLHWSPKQEYFKKFAPMSVGVVYLQRPGEGEAELRWHFRTMKELGFTSTKQLLTTPDWTFEDAGMIALE